MHVYIICYAVKINKYIIPILPHWEKNIFLRFWLQIVQLDRKESSFRLGFSREGLRILLFIASHLSHCNLNSLNVLLDMGPLMLTKDSQEYAVIEGGDVVMNCSVFSSPPSSISW